MTFRLLISQKCLQHVPSPRYITDIVVVCPSSSRLKVDFDLKSHESYHMIHMIKGMKTIVTIFESIL